MQENASNRKKYLMPGYSNAEMWCFCVSGGGFTGKEGVYINGSICGLVLRCVRVSVSP